MVILNNRRENNEKSIAGRTLRMTSATFTAKPTLLLMLAATTLCANSCTSTPELRNQLLETPLTAQLGGDTSRPLATSEAFTFVAANANPDTRAKFSAGNTIFVQSWGLVGLGPADADGLGPVFNRTACSNCHMNNGRGRAPTGPDQELQSMLVRISIPGQDPENNRPTPVPGYGDQIQDRAIAGVPAEARIRIHWQERSGRFDDGTAYALRTPRIEVSELAFGPLPGDTMLSARVANPLLGLGLLEMIPVETLQRLADPNDRDNDGISGRVNVVFNPRDGDMAVGRFGWKANAPNLTSQNAAAAHGDMGITSPLFPTDNCPDVQVACLAAATHDGIEMSADTLRSLNIYTRWLAVPQQRGAGRPEVRNGFEIFKAFGCAGCHLPTLTTGTDPRAPDLSNQVIHPFTDLLLHDMGAGLADGRPDFLAGGREWRTPPLWGIGLTAKVSGHTEFLHDGRARSLEEAILWHGGEAQASRDRFTASDAGKRAALLAFLNSL